MKATNVRNKTAKMSVFTVMSSSFIPVAELVWKTFKLQSQLLHTGFYCCTFTLVYQQVLNELKGLLSNLKRWISYDLVVKPLPDCNQWTIKKSSPVVFSELQQHQPSGMILLIIFNSSDMLIVLLFIIIKWNIW